VTDHLAEDDEDALAILRRIAGTFGPKPDVPWQLRAAAPPAAAPESVYEIVPPDPRIPYDVREVIKTIVDAPTDVGPDDPAPADGPGGPGFHEFKAEYGSSLVTGFAHIDGHPVGIVANNGVLFAESA